MGYDNMTGNRSVSDYGLAKNLLCDHVSPMDSSASGLYLRGKMCSDCEMAINVWDALEAEHWKRVTAQHTSATHAWYGDEETAECPKCGMETLVGHRCLEYCCAAFTLHNRCDHCCQQIDWQPHEQRRGVSFTHLGVMIEARYVSL